MHHIYHTEGIILRSRNFGEDSKYFYIFTRELGMVIASASGVRKPSSKLRFILQDFSYLNFDLVRGRDFWRLTSAGKTGELENLTKSFEVYRRISNIGRLLGRLLPGEEANPALFDNLVAGFKTLEIAERDHDVKNTEIVIVLKILSGLGYLAAPEVEDLVEKIKTDERQVLTLINQVLKETHL